MIVIPRVNNRPGKDGKSFPVAWINGSICFFSEEVPTDKEVEVMITGRSKTQIKLPDGSYQPATLFVAPVTTDHQLLLVRGFESDYIRLKDVAPGEPTHREYGSAFLTDDRKHKVKSCRVPVYKHHVNMGAKPIVDKLHPCSVWAMPVPGRNGLYNAIGLNDVGDIDHVVMIKREEMEPVVRDSKNEQPKRSTDNSSRVAVLKDAPRHEEHRSRSSHAMAHAFETAATKVKSA